MHRVLSERKLRIHRSSLLKIISDLSGDVKYGRRKQFSQSKTMNFQRFPQSIRLYGFSVPGHVSNRAVLPFWEHCIQSRYLEEGEKQEEEKCPIHTLDYLSRLSCYDMTGLVHAPPTIDREFHCRRSYNRPR
ncbi:hypothetical protein CEXT_673331 [Caerostris extrusa]|uniref:Uncharacterized protein n=1 Tax=Caerostris extrusa TaxID=172846 RepID=A0AAV4Y7F3_CAEEX|nr:hypothetical protein CEXT_673331 [Caerostris extrusa]